MIVPYAEAAEFVGDATLATDSRFKDIVESCDAFAKRYCNRSFDRATYTVLLEGTGEGAIVLPERIESITSISIDRWGEFGADALQSDLTRFVVGGSSQDERRLTWLDGRFPIGRNNGAAALVVFVGGYYASDDTDPLHVPKMPADLRLAVKRMIAADWSGGNITGERFKSESLGEYSYTRDTSVSSSDFPYEDRVRDVLNDFASWGR